MKEVNDVDYLGFVRIIDRAKVYFDYRKLMVHLKEMDLIDDNNPDNFYQPDYSVEPEGVEFIFTGLSIDQQQNT